MNVTFLGHSGFLVELESRCLLFDWWKGDLPALPDKPLFCFVSHRHEDHFDPRIFALARQGFPVHYVLSRDIRLGEKKRTALGLDAAVLERITFLRPGERLALPESGLEVETLRSTDAGVAFLVTAGERTIYHAGDLNWWHWAEESKAWNRNMEVNFKRYLEPLYGRRVDLAFVPLDPTQKEACDWGFLWLLGHADVRLAFPMHLWEDFSAVSRLRQAHPELAGRVADVRENGQRWALPD